MVSRPVCLLEAELRFLQKPTKLMWPCMNVCAGKQKCDVIDCVEFGLYVSARSPPRWHPPPPSHLPLHHLPQHPRLFPRGHAAGVPDCDRGDRARDLDRLARLYVPSGAGCDALRAAGCRATACPEPLPASVGRITGMVDCKWTGGSRVSLGQKLIVGFGSDGNHLRHRGEGHLAGAGDV